MRRRWFNNPDSEDVAVKLTILRLNPRILVCGRMALVFSTKLRTCARFEVGGIPISQPLIDENMLFRS